MMLMCRTAIPLWISGKKVITGIVFFVLKGLGMFERGFYGSELANKKRYWPTKMYGYGINANYKIHE